MAAAPMFIIQPEVDDNWTIEHVATLCPPVGCEKLFEHSLPELRTVSAGIQNEKSMGYAIFPQMKDMFQAFRLTPISSVKVVIVGQDPYHSVSYLNGQAYPTATGVSFSVRKWDKIPSSLQNIYKELAQSVPGFVTPDHGDLTSWALQGVLMLNTCLTVRSGQAGSHDPIVWDGFISKVIEAIKAVNPHCIYVMWGKDAQKLMSKLSEPAVKLTAVHPSGLSAYKGFFGCNHFNLINQHLSNQGKTPINWHIPSLQDQWSQVYSVVEIIAGLAQNQNQRAEISGSDASNTGVTSQSQGQPQRHAELEHTSSSSAPAPGP